MFWEKRDEVSKSLVKGLEEEQLSIRIFDLSTHKQEQIWLLAMPIWKYWYYEKKKQELKKADATS